MRVLYVALWALVHYSECSVLPLGNLSSVAVGKLAGGADAGPPAVKDSGADARTTAGKDSGVDAGPPANKDSGADRRTEVKKKGRSTSSSSGERSNGERSEDSLGIEETLEEENDAKQTFAPNSPRGWRKWHRRCQPCPEDMVKKWRDPSIRWICGGYQRARRSFKSECMMQLRNCQDGTMFTKVTDHRCNDQAPGYRGGTHFLYDYFVRLPDDNSDEDTVDSDSITSNEEDSDDKSA